MLAGSAVLATGTQVLSSYTPKSKSAESLKLKGNINHSVCRWCYDSIPLEEFCQAVKEIGIPAIDLVAAKRLAHCCRNMVFTVPCVMWQG